MRTKPIKSKSFTKKVVFKLDVQDSPTRSGLEGFSRFIERLYHFLEGFGNLLKKTMNNYYFNARLTQDISLF